MKHLVMFLAVLGALAVPATAAAARPPVSQHAADVEANDTLQSQLGVDDWGVYAGATMTGFELDPCEVERRSAACDFTATFDDGDVCDGTVTVYRSRRGRILSDWTLDYCDSDDAEK